MYQRPTIAVVGSVRGLTLQPIQACKLGHGADEFSMVPGLADLSGEPKDPHQGPEQCFVS
jgi:hypothetical protein